MLLLLLLQGGSDYAIVVGYCVSLAASSPHCPTWHKQYLNLLLLLLLLLQGGSNYAYSRLCATGWIITALSNLALIFVLGWRPRKLRGAAGGPIKY
jgi:hypothetical protein